MRLQNPSEEFSRQDQVRPNVENDQNGIENNDYDEEQLNCPMLFKTCLVSLVTCGILAFVISFGVEIDNSPNLVSNDFSNCVDHSNVRRLVKSYAYEKIILGLLISAVVISFGLTIFMIYLSSTYCQCFGQCFPSSSQPSQQASNNGDIGKYEIQLRKRIAANILMPKSQLNDSCQQSFNQNIEKKRQLKQNKRQQKIKHQMRRFKKSREEIQRFNEQYAKYIKNSRSDQFDCQCEDCGACAAYCLGCLWCRSCFDAHHYHFYNSKTEEYTYWIAYMIKTFLFGFALAYVIRIYVSLSEVNYCMSDNSKLYETNLQVPMIIGIITAFADAFGYIHLFVQGTLLDIVSDTFHEKRKSQHSDDDQNHQPMDGHQKKNKKHRRSEESYKSENHITPKQQKGPIKKQEDNQGLYQFQSKYNLFKSDKKQKQKQPEQRDIDSFFIKLKTIGKKYLDNIDSQVEQNGKNKPKQNKKQIMSEESYYDSNKKPRIQVPQSFYNLPIKHVAKMQREQPRSQQPSLNQSIIVGEQLHQKEHQHRQKQVKFDINNDGFQKSKGYGQYGGFNKRKEQQSDDKANKENGFIRLRKFSTQF